MVADQIKAVFKAMKVPDELINQIMPYISKDGSKSEEMADKMDDKKEETEGEDVCPKCGAKCEGGEAKGVSVAIVKKRNPLEEMFNMK